MGDYSQFKPGDKVRVTGHEYPWLHRNMKGHVARVKSVSLGGRSITLEFMGDLPSDYDAEWSQVDLQFVERPIESPLEADIRVYLEASNG